MKVGFTKLSTIDYPGKICSVIFMPHCNFRCGYCHNQDVVDGNVDRKLDDVLKELAQDQKIISSVCISGGEPTLHPELATIAKELKKQGFLLKLDTNGSNPYLLETVLPYLDYVAMDIKGPLSRYSAIAKYDEINKILRSISLVRTLKDYEFRTTISPTYLLESDVLAIANLIQGSKKYVLQGYKKARSDFEAEEPTKEWLQQIASLVKPYFTEVMVRGGK